MDPIWRELPVELVEHVCNQLPKVRSISHAMKHELTFRPLELLIKNTMAWFGRDDGYQLLLDDLNLLNESDFNNLYEVWEDMDVDKRLEYYHSVMD